MTYVDEAEIEDHLPEDFYDHMNDVCVNAPNGPDGCWDEQEPKDSSHGIGTGQIGNGSDDTFEPPVYSGGLEMGPMQIPLLPSLYGR